MTRPGDPTGFEVLVDDYDAARPTYPADLYDALPPLAGRRLLELGAGTGLATQGLLSRGASVVSTDLGPRMLGRLHSKHPEVPVAVARAEALPFADGSFDAVCGAQMWHWTSPPAAEEVARVLAPGGWLALWWNEVSADGEPWWDLQQDVLEAESPHYTRGYRMRDWAAELAAVFPVAQASTLPWQRRIDVDLYERWMRSKSYVQTLRGGPPAVDAFVARVRASLLEHFPDGVVVEPFAVRLWLLRRG